MNKLTSFEAHLDKYNGKIGSEERAKFDSDSRAFRIGVMLHEARKEAKMTQEEITYVAGNKTVISQE